MTSTTSPPLSAPLDIEFDYTRSLGPTLGAFVAGLARREILGARSSDGQVLVPPPEYDPTTHQPVGDLIRVGDTGVVTTWSWNPRPVQGQPLDIPFAWAMIQPDGADSAILHAVRAPLESMRTGLRVRASWAETTGNGMRDILCFEPEQPGTGEPDGADAVPSATEPGPPAEQLVTPIRLAYMHSASAGESQFLRALAEGRLTGQRCPVCAKVYVPPRGACPVDGVPTEDEVALSDRGTVTTFCIVNVPFLGQGITPPYVAAYVLLDGADIALQHLILDCPAEDVRMGMRVEAVWRPRAEWGFSLENISHFRPTGEPDVPYESFAQHL